MKKQTDMAEDFFRKAAEKEGLSYTDWCRKYGVMCDADDQKIRRHEVPIHDGK